MSAVNALGEFHDEFVDASTSFGTYPLKESILSAGELGANVFLDVSELF